MHAPVALGIGVRFVAGVDQWPGAGRCRGDRVPHLVGPLGEDVARVSEATGMGRATGLRIRGDVTGTHEDLPGHQVGNKGARVVPEVAATTHEIVLMAAEAIALGVAVVLQQVDPSGNSRCGQAGVGLLGQVRHDQLTGAVLGEQIRKTVALGGSELRVGAHVQVKASAPTGEDIRGT